MICASMLRISRFLTDDGSDRDDNVTPIPSLPGAVTPELPQDHKNSSSDSNRGDSNVDDELQKDFKSSEYNSTLKAVNSTLLMMSIFPEFYCLVF